MPTSSMPLGDYAAAVRGEVMKYAPAESMRVHAAGWRNVLPKIFDASGIYEVASIVIARWEFLGGLYRGTTDDTTQADAAAYARRFLPQYDHTHDLVGRRTPNVNMSDMFRILRNKPLHGFTPAGVASDDNKRVVGWSVGSTDSHLVVDRGALWVDCLQLCKDLCKSMEAFADYVDQNTDLLVGTRLPRDRWVRAFWARFCPVNFPRNTWMTTGETDHGIPV